MNQTDIANQASAEPYSDAVRQNKTHTQKHLIIGIWLIAVGMAWILWNARWINWAWTERYGFMLLGTVLLAQNIIRRKMRIALGTALILVGAFHLYLDYAEFSARHLWPVYLLIAGFALILNYIANTRRWFSLISGIFLAGFGSIFFAREMDFIPYSLALMARTYWPLTLVLGGIIIILVTLIKNKKQA